MTWLEEYRSGGGAQAVTARCAPSCRAESADGLPCGTQAPPAHGARGALRRPTARAARSAGPRRAWWAGAAAQVTTLARPSYLSHLCTQPLMSAKSALRGWWPRVRAGPAESVGRL